MNLNEKISGHSPSKSRKLKHLKLGREGGLNKDGREICNVVCERVGMKKSKCNVPKAKRHGSYCTESSFNLGREWK